MLHEEPNHLVQKARSSLHLHFKLENKQINFLHSSLDSEVDHVTITTVLIVLGE